MSAIDVFSRLDGHSLRDAAHMFATEGAPVFPCVPGGKRPLVTHGFHDATTDAAQIHSWWSRWPNANIGIPTGAVSGVEVIDVDVATTGTGFPAFRTAHREGLAAGWAALVRTPSGGLHAYYPADTTKSQSSWQATKAHIDFRGAGGYIIAPPSLITRPNKVRAPYRLILASGSATQPVDAARLREFLNPQTPPAGGSRVARPERHGAERHGAERQSADAQALAEWVAGRGEGERNRGLFWAACRLAESGAPPAATLEALRPAAERAGLGSREIFVTIRSAYRTIHPAPRTVEEPGIEARRLVRGAPGRVLS